MDAEEASSGKKWLIARWRIDGFKSVKSSQTFWHGLVTSRVSGESEHKAFKEKEEREAWLSTYEDQSQK